MTQFSCEKHHAFEKDVSFRSVVRYFLSSYSSSMYRKDKLINERGDWESVQIDKSFQDRVYLFFMLLLSIVVPGLLPKSKKIFKTVLKCSLTAFIYIILPYIIINNI